MSSGHQPQSDLQVRDSGGGGSQQNQSNKSKMSETGRGLLLLPIQQGADALKEIKNIMNVFKLIVDEVHHLWLNYQSCN